MAGYTYPEDTPQLPPVAALAPFLYIDQTTIDAVIEPSLVDADI